MPADLYEILGVGRRATTREIRAAYLAKAKALHPDVGGDDEEFARVQKAYAILNDQVRRAKYDATGDETETSPLNEQVPALTAIHRMLVQVLSRDKPMGAGLMLEMKDAIRKSDEERKRLLANCRQVVTRCEKHAKSFKRKKSDDEPNIFEAAMEYHARQASKQIDTIEKELEHSAAALKLLDEYEFEPDLFLTSQWRV